VCRAAAADAPELVVERADQAHAAFDRRL